MSSVATLKDSELSRLLQDSWRAEPASLAVKLSRGSWQRVPHLSFISERLSEMTYRPLRLLIEIPPRMGKSELLSHWTPVWFLDRFPDRRVLLGTYEASFAATWGAKARDEVDEYRELLNLKPCRDKWAANHWELETGGGMNTAGVGGPFTGKGAGLGILDDPTKNIEEALSPVYREKTWEWYRRVFRTRIEPGGSIVGAMQRWHVDDLFGRIERESGEKWEVIKMPMIAGGNDSLGRSPGEMLWPGRYSEKEIQDIKAGVGEDGWNAQYQQQPEANAGECFFDVAVLHELSKTAKPGPYIGKYFPGRRYAAGIDCAGEGQDRHSLTIKDCVTGLHVVQYAADVSVDEFAYKSHKILREFNEPLVGIESNGVGLAMITVFKGLGYKNFIVQAKDPTKVGIASSSNLRMQWLVNYAMALKNGTATPSTKDAIDEHFNFVKKPNGPPGHLPGCHDDQVFSAVWAEYASNSIDTRTDEIKIHDVRESNKMVRRGDNRDFTQPYSFRRNN